DVVRASSGNNAAARDKYDREYLSVVQRGDGFQAFQGRYQRQIETAELYRLLGRADLAEAHEERSTLKVVLIVGGLAGMALGVGMAINDINSPALPVVCVGGGVFIVGLVIPPAWGMEPSALRETVDKYNLGLKKKLELAGAGAPGPSLAKGRPR